MFAADSSFLKGQPGTQSSKSGIQGSNVDDEVTDVRMEGGMAMPKAKRPMTGKVGLSEIN